MMRCDQNIFTQEQYWHFAHAIYDVLLQLYIYDGIDVFQKIDVLLEDHPYAKVHKVHKIFSAVKDARSE